MAGAGAVTRVLIPGSQPILEELKSSPDTSNYLDSSVSPEQLFYLQCIFSAVILHEL